MTRLTHKPTDKAIDSRDGSKTISELAREERVWLDAQRCVTRCGFEGCDWKFDGPAGAGRVEAKTHREATHPDLEYGKGRKRKINLGAEAEARRDIHARAQQRDRVAALERMGAGEPQQPAAPEATRLDPDAPEKRTKHTLDSIIGAVIEYAAEHGHAPPSTRPPWAARAQAAKARFGLTWADVVREAGTVPTPTGAAAHKRPLESVDGTIGAGPSADSSGPGVDEQVITGSATEAILSPPPVEGAASERETGEPTSTSVRDSRAPKPPDPAWPLPTSGGGLQVTRDTLGDRFRAVAHLADALPIVPSLNGRELLSACLFQLTELVDHCYPEEAADVVRAA